MGIVSSCFLLAPSTSCSAVKLVFWGGAVELLRAKSSQARLAGEILFKYPDRIVCQADSFYIGHPIPVLSIDDKLIAGQTYFVLPVDCFPNCSNLTTAALASLSSCRRKPEFAAGSTQFPFEYLRSAADGRMLIRVLPEFMVRVMSLSTENAVDEEKKGEEGVLSGLCSTPELRKHYEQLVGGPRDRPWSPKLETITEKKPRSSPVRLLSLGLERR